MLKHRLAVMALTILLGSVVGMAEAGERHSRNQADHHGRGQAIIGSNGLPSVIPGIGTFAGSISGLVVAVSRQPAWDHNLCQDFLDRYGRLF